MNTEAIKRFLANMGIKAGDTLGVLADGSPMVRFLAAAPTGTATGLLAINLAGTTANTIFYGNVNGTWTAWTIS